MEITIKFRDDEARRLQYFLRIRYKSKAELPNLAKIAVIEAAGMEARKQLSKEGE